MKIFLSFLVIAFLCLQYSTADEVNMAEKQWQDYKLQHNKVYDETEDAVHFEIYKKNLAMIEEHNAKYARGETTYTMGINHMTDWTPEQRKRLTGAIPPRQQ